MPRSPTPIARDAVIVPAAEDGRNRPLGIIDHDTFVRLGRSRDFLAAHAHERVLLEQAAREATFSPFHYQRLFVRAFGESPLEFLTRLRMERAKRLLAAGSMPVTHICFEVGYESLGSFSTRFSAVVGISPSEYRRSVRRSVALSRLWRPHFIPTCFLSNFVRPLWRSGEGPQDPRSIRGE